MAAVNLYFTYQNRIRAEKLNKIDRVKSLITDLYELSISAIQSQGAEALALTKELTRKYKRLHALCVDEMELETLLAHHELTDKLSDFECFCIADDLAFLDFDECEGNGRFEKMDISRKNLIRGINATAKKLWNIKV